MKGFNLFAIRTNLHCWTIRPAPLVHSYTPFTRIGLVSTENRHLALDGNSKQGQTGLRRPGNYLPDDWNFLEVALLLWRCTLIARFESVVGGNFPG